MSASFSRWAPFWIVITYVTVRSCLLNVPSSGNGPPQNNHHGCNYTLVPVTNFHNNSAEMIFFYVGSFSNVSHHMIIGKHYQMSAEKCQGLGNASEEQQMAITMTSTQKTCNGNPPRSSGIILFASPILEQMVFFFCVIIYLNSFP